MSARGFTFRAMGAATPAAPESAFVTVLWSANGKASNKNVKIVNGKPKKDSYGDLGSYFAQVARVDTPEAMAEVLRLVGDRADHLISLGYVPALAPSDGDLVGQPFRIMSRRLAAKALGLPFENVGPEFDPVFGNEPRTLPGYDDALCITRTKSLFQYGGWMLFDRDPSEEMPDDIRAIVADDDAWLAAMSRLAPGMATAGRVRLRSTTGRVLWNGAPLASAGSHEYVRLDVTRAVGLFGHRLGVTAALSGLTWAKPSRDRTTGKIVSTIGNSPIWDATTFSPERLAFVGKPVVLSAGLSLDNNSRIEVFPGPALALADTPEHSDDAVDEASRRAGVEFGREKIVRTATGTTVSFDTPVTKKDDLRLDTRIRFATGEMTVREACLADMHRSRTQVPDEFRSSATWNGIFNRTLNALTGEVTPSLFDNGSRIMHLLSPEEEHQARNERLPGWKPALEPTAPYYPRPTRTGAEAADELDDAMVKFIMKAVKVAAAQEWIQKETERTKEIYLPKAFEEIKAERLAKIGGNGIEDIEDAEAFAEERGPHRAEVRARRFAKKAAEKLFGKKAAEGRFQALQIAGSAGLGKTRTFIRIYLANPALWNINFAFYLPTLENCKDFEADLMAGVADAIAKAEANGTIEQANGATPRALGIQARAARGMCRRAKATTLAPNAGCTSVYTSFCHTPAAGDRDEQHCEFFGPCQTDGYLAQFTDTAPAVRVFPHKTMPLGQPEEIRLPTPTITIVDESAVSALVVHQEVDPALIDDPGTYSADKGEEHIIQESMDVARIVATAISGPEPVAAIVAAGVTPDQLRTAAKSADAGAKYAAPRLHAGMNEETSLRRMEGRTRHQGDLVANVMRQLARDIEAGRTTSTVIEWDKNHIAKTKVGTEIACPIILRHGLQDTDRIPRNCALLLLDHNANIEINRQLFRREFDAVEIYAIRNADVTQIYDAALTKGSMLTRNKSGKSERLCSRVTAMIEREAAKADTVTFTPKAVRARLVGKKSEDLEPWEEWRGCDISHFGRERGNNRWEHFRTVIILGREQTNVIDLERTARAIWADAPTVTLKLAGELTIELRAHDMRHGQSKPVEVQVHPDKHVQMCMELTREGGMGQGIDRLRLIHNDPNKPKRVLVVSNIPIPGLVVDRLISLEDMLEGGTVWERALEKTDGIVPLSDDWLEANMLDLFGKKTAAGCKIATLLKNPDWLSTLYSQPGFYRLAGQRRPSRVLVRCDVANPKEALSKLLGAEVVEFRMEQADTNGAAPEADPGALATTATATCATLFVLGNAAPFEVVPVPPPVAPVAPLSLVVSAVATVTATLTDAAAVPLAVLAERSRIASAEQYRIYREQSDAAHAARLASRTRAA